MSTKSINIILSFIFFLCVFVISLFRITQHIVVFCDVGQGAATLFQMGSIQVLVDTGPDGRVLSCLGRHMSYFDRTIEFVIVSHNQSDHNGGLAFLQKKYLIKQIIGPSYGNKNKLPQGYREVVDEVVISLPQLVFKIKKSSQSLDKNESANVVTVISPKNTFFLSSDISSLQLLHLMPQSTTVLQVPHHGSKYGLSPLSLSLAQPTLAVISVGKNNIYGHPSYTVLDLLKAKNIPFMRTDVQGDIILPLR